MVEKKTQPTAKSWHAVSVLPGARACADALALCGKRFLSGSEAPALPLPGCSAPATCKCVYKHHEDRRAGPRRADERSGIGRAPAKEEKRKKRGRRESDLVD